MINAKQILKSLNVLTDDARQRIDVFASPASNQKNYILGRNSSAEKLVEKFGMAHFKGIIDDFSPAADWHGLPVVKGDTVPAGSIAINCSTSISPTSAHKKLVSLSLTVLSYADLCKAFADLPQPDFVALTRQDLALNPQAWEKVDALLSDAKSKETLKNILAFRMTGDYLYMKDYTVRFHDQYFDEIVKTSADEVFVDCGGFDGDTTLEFVKRYPSYKKIIIFEPSDVNFAKAKINLKDVKDVDIFPLGVSDKPGTLFFNASNGSASSVNDSGTSKIEVVTIDDVIQEKVTFIKMDLEGWELHALQGARRHILEDHPKLAISVYHHPSDFWRIPEYVLGLRADYDIYIRHYSEGWSETVMYFLPKP